MSELSFSHRRGGLMVEHGRALAATGLHQFLALACTSPQARWPRMLMALFSGMIVLAIGAGL
jgi:hypothetical protein